MLDNIQQDANARMDSAVGHTQNELNKIRTGRANPEIFDSIVSIKYFQYKKLIISVTSFKIMF